MEDSVGVMSPKYNLEPPHYDGIQSLCLMGDLLFTGSRDMCIKKWDLAEQQQKHVSHVALSFIAVGIDMYHSHVSQLLLEDVWFTYSRFIYLVAELLAHRVGIPVTENMGNSHCQPLA